MALAIGSFLRVSTERGTPIVVGNRTITPIAGVFTIGGKLPGLPAGLAFAWVRPARVEVREGGLARSIPIPDVTLGARIGLAMAALLIDLLLSRGRTDKTGYKEDRP